MRNIKKIREQVVATEQLFGQFIEQHAKYSERLIHLMTAVEERIQAQQNEVERQRAEIASLNEENEQLSDITWSLLQTIKEGKLDLVNDMIRTLNLKVSQFVEEDANEEKAPEQAAGNEAEVVLVVTEDAALDTEVVPTEDRVATAS